MTFTLLCILACCVTALGILVLGGILYGAKWADETIEGFDSPPAGQAGSQEDSKEEL